MRNRWQTRESSFLPLAKYCKSVWQLCKCFPRISRETILATMRGCFCLFSECFAIPAADATFWWRTRDANIRRRGHHFYLSFSYAPPVSSCSRTLKKKYIYVYVYNSVEIPARRRNRSNRRAAKWFRRFHLFSKMSAEIDSIFRLEYDTVQKSSPKLSFPVN